MAVFMIYQKMERVPEGVGHYRYRRRVDDRLIKIDLSAAGDVLQKSFQVLMITLNDVSPDLTCRRANNVRAFIFIFTCSSSSGDEKHHAKL
jgi:hypothetical protein